MAITSLLRFWNTYKNIKRIKQIVNVFLRHGFGQFIEQINLQRFIPLRKRFRLFKRWAEVERYTMPQRLRIAFSELGPSFIKFAQILSSRPDLITAEYADEFKKLQDKVPPFSSESAGRIIEAELGKPLEELFDDFEEMPVAAASIAQVHNALLKTGEKVVIKIQRPGIRETIETDIAILNAIVRLILKYIPESRYFNPQGIVDEFSKSVRKEIDFVAEARNAMRFRKNFEGDDTVCIPVVYSELLTEKVIVMERLEGVRIDDIEGIDSLGVDRKVVANRGVNAYFKMIFEDGFFHADPHPGNLFVMDDGRIGLIDFGIVGWLTSEMMENIANAFLAVLNRNFDRLVDLYIDLGIVTDEVNIETFRSEFKTDLIYLLEPLYDVTISEVNFPEYLEALTRLVIKHGLKLPSDLLLMDKTILILDNIGRQLDPKFNAATAAEPYAAKLVKERMNPEKVLDRAKNNMTEISGILLNTPMQLNRLLKKVLKDELSFKIDPVGMEKLILDIDRSSNRIAFSLIVAAIIVGSSMLVQSDIGGKLFGLSSIGLIGFLVAFMLGLRLVISIIRSGRM
ncbi:MAG: AarF/ABC1/UbiB kinase family protein [Nitrospira sp.]|nr:AarF/ABC1/UbiB kinase family protein [Nitrospira sp.]